MTVVAWPPPYVANTPPQPKTSSLVGDLLAQLSQEVQAGDGREVEKRPSPSTRGRRDTSGPGGRKPELMSDAEWATQVDAARSRLADGNYTDQDVAIMRERTRSPWSLTNEVPCGEDCPHQGHPRHYNGAEIGASVCDVDGTCWEAERQAIAEFVDTHRRRPHGADALFRRGVPVLRVVETTPAEEAPIEKLARGKVGHPPKMTDEQIEAAMTELASGEITVRLLAKREWQTWGFKTMASADAALRRYQRLRAAQQLNDHQEVAA